MVTELLKELDKDFREISRGFYHSSIVIDYKVEDKRITLDLRDVLLASAISGSNVLLIGSTGGGKTTLAKMLALALFSDNYAFLQIDSTLDITKFYDIAFGKIKEGGRLTEALEENKFIRAPIVILDEINRAPPALFNILQNYLTNGELVFEGGKSVKCGIRLNGDYYQLKVGTMNEGVAYRGTHLMDKASRDRFVVEINFDVFKPTIDDRRSMLLNGKTPTIEKGYDNTNTVLKLYQEVKKIPLSDIATEFLLYLTRVNQCIKSPEGTKLSINSNVKDFCKGCSAFAPDKGICGNVYAPSERTILNLVNFSKSIAMYRVYKTGGSLEVLLEDVLAAAPFVFYSKIDINSEWVNKYGRGSLWNAISEFIKISYLRWINGLKENKEIIDKIVKKDTLKEEEEKDIISYCEKDPWFCTEEYIRKTIESRREV